MRPISFPGTFEDSDGMETLTWRIQSSDRSGWAGRYEIRTRIRDVDVWGVDFDGLEPDVADPSVLRLNSASEITQCVLTGDMPCTSEFAGQRRPTTVRFELDLREQTHRPTRDPSSLLLSTVVDGATYAITDDWFEDGAIRLDGALRPNHLVCCATCLFSDYSPYGHGLMGMRCHRDAKIQYLAVRSKTDYMSVPVTEEVPETYLCDEYARRVPGTGYRG